jgi:hypothetical protein
VTDSEQSGAPDLRDESDLPVGIAPYGVPRDGEGRQLFIVLLSVVVALLGLIFTLGWVVLHHLAAS